MEEEFDEMPAPSQNYSSYPDSGQKRFRLPAAKELPLSKVTGSEELVAVIGSIAKLDKQGMTAVLESAGLQCALMFTETDQLICLSEGAIIRIIGKPSKNEKLSIEVEMAHELKGFDSNLYEKIKELEKKAYGSE